jgi:hypothetical protein
LRSQCSSPNFQPIMKIRQQSELAMEGYLNAN